MALVSIERKQNEKSPIKSETKQSKEYDLLFSRLLLFSLSRFAQNRIEELLATKLISKTVIKSLSSNRTHTHSKMPSI